MHCFIWSALLGVAAAASVRPIISNSRTESGPAKPQGLRRGYQEQDTARAFYSYGYSDDNAARAEYTTGDGSSRGFYSYVDANGQLQTVNYEAGGSQGFRAEGSSLPKAPIDDRKPVMDTAEVQEARQAHLSAIRQAKDEARAAKRREQSKQQQAQDQNAEQQGDEQALSDEDAAILERVRAELTSMLAERQREEQRESTEQRQKQTEATAENEDKIQEQKQEQEQERKPTPARNEDNDARLRTVYTLADLRSSSYLKLGDLEDRLDRNGQELRIPVSAYYSYVSPNAKYSVTTPTELRTLRPVALSRSLLLSKRN